MRSMKNWLVRHFGIPVEAGHLVLASAVAPCPWTGWPGSGSVPGPVNPCAISRAFRTDT